MYFQKYRCFRTKYISADSNNDTLTFAGSGIAITTDDTTDTVTFTVTDAGGTVTCVWLLYRYRHFSYRKPNNYSGKFCITYLLQVQLKEVHYHQRIGLHLILKQLTGTVTSVSGGTGLTGTVTTSGNISVDYSGSDNIITGATDCTGSTVYE